MILAALLACSGESAPGGDDTDTGLTEATGCDAPLSVTPTFGDPQEGIATIVHGPQGGWHLESAALVEASAQEVAVTTQLYVPSLALSLSAEPLPSYLALAGYDGEVCSGEFWAMRSLVQPPALPPGTQCLLELVCALEDVEVELDLEVTDLPSGDTATSAATARMALDPGDAELCGQPIGDGDADGVRDLCDLCPEHDNADDADGDGTPDGCEPTP